MCRILELVDLRGYAYAGLSKTWVLEESTLNGAFEGPYYDGIPSQGTPTGAPTSRRRSQAAIA
jgi:hypothetical protein